MLRDILREREEFLARSDEESQAPVAVNPACLFYGRTESPKRSITIGPGNGDDDLCIKMPDEHDDESIAGPFLRVKRGTGRRNVFMQSIRPEHYATRLWDAFWSQKSPNSDREIASVKCASIGPGLPTNRMLATSWDNVALTEEEELSIRALRFIAEHVERVAVIGFPSRAEPSMVVTLKGNPLRVPLRSLGDGATRLFAASLALASSRDGFLVIDEAENGLHATVQRSFWRMVFGAAEEFNIQVFATTHSWDCVRGFARAAKENQQAEGVYVRLERAADGEVRAVEYSEDLLNVAADQDIEVR